MCGETCFGLTAVKLINVYLMKCNLRLNYSWISVFFFKRIFLLMIWRMNCLRDSQDILLICVLIINLLQSIPVLVVCPFRLDCALLLISWCEICELSLAPGTFIVYSYKYQHDDGRVSYPLCFIFSSPVGKKHLLWVYGTHCSLHCLVIKVVNAGICLCLAGCRPEQMMMYAGSKNKLVHTVQLSKVSERLLTKTPIHNKTLVLT